MSSDLTDGRMGFGFGTYPSGSTAELRPVGNGYFDVFANGVRVGLSNGLTVGALNIIAFNTSGQPVLPSFGCP